MTVASGPSPASSALQAFRDAVLADAQIQLELWAFADTDGFAALATARAEAMGIALDGGELARALRPDPAGISRWIDAEPTDRAPPAAWLPINILPSAGGSLVDWACFGTTPLTAPFFEGSIRDALRHPLNRLVRCRTPLKSLPQHAARDSVAAAGFVFHMSRCGSTLVTQMLATDPRNIVVSEAHPIDQIVRSWRASPPDALDTHAELLAALVAALGRRRSGLEERYLIKLDSWHALALPLFRRAFPSVPWVFLYREPAPVMASHLQNPSTQTMPEYMRPEVYGLSETDTAPVETYWARILDAVCRAALVPGLGGGRLIHYSQLPDALWTEIMPHFGITSDDTGRERMRAAARFDAKFPERPFRDDLGKENVLTAELRAAVEHYVGGAYAALEDARRAQPKIPPA